MTIILERKRQLPNRSIAFNLQFELCIVGSSDQMFDRAFAIFVKERIKKVSLKLFGLLKQRINFTKVVAQLVSQPI